MISNEPDHLHEALDAQTLALCAELEARAVAIKAAIMGDLMPAYWALVNLGDDHRHMRAVDRQCPTVVSIYCRAGQYWEDDERYDAEQAAKAGAGEVAP